MLHINKVNYQSYSTKIRGPNGGITRLERKKQLPDDQKSMIIGMIQGDLSIRSNGFTTARLVVRQGEKQRSFVMHLYERLKDFVDTPPQTETLKASGKFKKRKSIWFQTQSYECFYDYYKQFYVEDKPLKLRLSLKYFRFSKCRGLGLLVYVRWFRCYSWGSYIEYSQLYFLRDSTSCQCFAYQFRI